MKKKERNKFDQQKNSETSILVTNTWEDHKKKNRESGKKKEGKEIKKMKFSKDQASIVRWSVKGEIRSKAETANPSKKSNFTDDKKYDGNK